MKSTRNKRNANGGRSGRGQRGWDPLAAWYDGMVGEKGSKYHQALAIPAVLRLLSPQKSERILDVGCGQGVLAQHVLKANAEYVGADVSKNLIESAKKRGLKNAEFHVKDAGRVHELKVGKFDAAVFMLSIQDIQNMNAAFESFSKLMKEQSRVVLLMLHPAFRIPRQSGWGFDTNRKLQYRRIDSYLSQMDVPLKQFPGRQRGVSKSYHRPLQDYVNSLSSLGFLISRIEEIPAGELGSGKDKSSKRAESEIPLFLAMKAEKRAP